MCGLCRASGERSIPEELQQFLGAGYRGALSDKCRHVSVLEFRGVMGLPCSLFQQRKGRKEKALSEG